MSTFQWEYCGKPKRGHCENNINDDERDGKKSPEFSKIKIPPKVLKRGRPKSVEVTVIGLPRKKKKKENRDKQSTQTTVSLSEPSVNKALDLRSIHIFWIAWQLLIDI